MPLDTCQRIIRSKHGEGSWVLACERYQVQGVTRLASSGPRPVPGAGPPWEAGEAPWFMPEDNILYSPTGSGGWGGSYITEQPLLQSLYK